MLLILENVDHIRLTTNITDCKLSNFVFILLIGFILCPNLHHRKLWVILTLVTIHVDLIQLLRHLTYIQKSVLISCLIQIWLHKSMNFVHLLTCKSIPLRTVITSNIKWYVHLTILTVELRPHHSHVNCKHQYRNNDHWAIKHFLI